ncbi:MAG: hypothetical protein QNJ33_09845 [Crocosphaera sp.]|nr:hypothetical protein [Crocosphaera sp.]
MKFDNFPLLTGLAIIINFFLFSLILITVITRKRKEHKIKQSHENFIKNYQFSSGFKEKFTKTRNYLAPEQQELVFSALKDYFLICYQAGKSMVSMPTSCIRTKILNN